MMTRAFGRNLYVTTKAPLLFWGVSSHFHFHCILVMRKHVGCRDISTIIVVIVALTFWPFSHHWRSTAMPWCWNTTRPDIYYLHSVNLTNGTLVFLGRGEGHSGVQVMQQDWQLSRWFACINGLIQPIQTVASARDTVKKNNEMLKYWFITETSWIYQAGTTVKYLMCSHKKCSVF